MSASCWMGAPGGGERVYKMVTNALKAKYRHIDTADGYNNEEEVGRAIRDSGVPRKDLFVTTKLNDTDHHRVSEAFDRSLGALDIGYIDLWLMHWPQSRKGGRCLAPDESPTIHETWAEMVKILDTGKVRAIGVELWCSPSQVAPGVDHRCPGCQSGRAAPVSSAGEYSQILH